ncbi:MAG: hypothetical protein R3D85_01950 [Paracoccaceae bacterium]
MQGNGAGDPGAPVRAGWRDMLRGAGVLPNLAANFLVAAVMMTTLIVGPFFLGPGLGLSEARVGLVMSVGPAISIASGVPSGQLVDRWGADRVPQGWGWR